MILTTLRQYNPAKGRRLYPGLMGYGGGVHLYDYTGNNPANAVDL
jgi:RHS repeat-associated protein